MYAPYPWSESYAYVAFLALTPAWARKQYENGIATYSKTHSLWLEDRELAETRQEMLDIPVAVQTGVVAVVSEI